ncbi:MAG TPA: hypothetical protein VGH74_10315 [Planctomycetaceae bacterium]|jgi:hypothetical protein
MAHLQRVTIFCLVVTAALVARRLVAAKDSPAKATRAQTSGAETTRAKTKEETDKSESLAVMLGQAKRMLVQIGETPAAPRPELKEQPLIHYSDRVRQLPESTLWVWEQKGAPVLFCKIERVTSGDGGAALWQYCCVPATTEKADVTWGRNFRWRARESSFHWSPLADAPEPRDQPRVRLTQLKAIAREFSGRTEQTQAQSRQEMRLLSNPLHQYAAPEKNVVDGAVFGLTSNGTNPDVLLLIEALGTPQEKSHWRYAVIGMTGDAAEVTHQGKKVWSKPFSDGPGDYRSWMWYVAE